MGVCVCVCIMRLPDIVNSILMALHVAWFGGIGVEVEVKISMNSHIRILFCILALLNKLKG